MHLESEQDVILSELAAKYLPKLLETYKKRDYPFNTAATLMNMVTHTPYFIRFCQQPEGEKLAALHTHRLATQGFHRDHLNEDNVGETCQFLSSLLVTIGSTTVDQKDKEALLPTLKEWRKRYRGEFAKETIGRCIDQLSHKGASGLGMMFLEPMMKAQLEKGVEICKSAKCSVSAKSIGHELMQCSRCKCVRYCCIEHQRADWPEHKRLCFQPNF
ncbi:hypothetical protein SCHPADRAFT_902668 [Schizopora paradoxa]|uniref:MYND-type domain-containing protein n=1 Tax=Schizopora paradoxa TaxID=27342 RepID=A0A0H2S038_9AGAM|nr:hypothetical protein SCHPADRAFT_902668 [Schizopora paradoxa]